MNFTKKQQELLDVITLLQDPEDGLPPTVMEIARELGIKKRSVYKRLALLEKEGCITREKGLLRSMKVALSSFFARNYRSIKIPFYEDNKGKKILYYVHLEMNNNHVDVSIEVFSPGNANNIPELRCSYTEALPF